MNPKLRTIATVLVTAALLTGAHPSFAENDGTPNAPSKMAKHYLAIQVALADDSLADVPDHAAALGDLAAEAARNPDSRDESNTAKRFATISTAAGELTRASNLAEARAAFGKISEILVDMNDLGAGRQVRVAYCPMAKKHWLQATDTIANPYYGAAMLRCGQFQDMEPTSQTGR